MSEIFRLDSVDFCMRTPFLSFALTNRTFRENEPPLLRRVV